jgi:hypothetical protein
MSWNARNAISLCSIAFSPRVITYEVRLSRFTVW